MKQILVAESNKAIKSDIRQKRIDADRKKLRQENLRIEEESWLATQSQPPGFQSEAPSTIKPIGYWQEKDIIRVLITFGSKLYQVEQEVTVAEYILTNLEDIENPFKNQLYNKVTHLCTELVNKGEPVESAYFVNNQDPEISKLAVDIIATPHSYADWEERGVMLQTQKHPEENYERDAFQSVMRFKLHKVKEGITEIQDQLKHPEQLAEQGLSQITLIKVLQLKMNERNEIARQLSTIIL